MVGIVNSTGTMARDMLGLRWPGAAEFGTAATLGDPVGVGRFGPELSYEPLRGHAYARKRGRSRSECVRIWPVSITECPCPLGNGCTAIESGPSIFFRSVPFPDLPASTETTSPVDPVLPTSSFREQERELGP